MVGIRLFNSLSARLEKVEIATKIRDEKKMKLICKLALLTLNGGTS